MERKDVFNFAAGPSAMPNEVLAQARDELLNYHGSGLSVMEMSHRSEVFSQLFQETKAALRRALQIPDTHEILFLQGGATTQFAMVPLNLLTATGTADYAVTGHFASVAAVEASKYGKICRVYDTTPTGHHSIPTQEELQVHPNASYFYYCANNTIYGTQWHYTPDTGAVPLVCDMSSEILSHPVDVRKYGLIFAGAQKNMAPAGLTVAIIRKSLLGGAMDITPTMLDYTKLAVKDSMLNTPPCWCIYMLGLQLQWLERQGGVEEMEERSIARSGLIYDYLDESKLFRGLADVPARSRMNVTFTTGSADLDAAFVKGAEARGLLHVKGHRIAGGMRASLYNAMTMEGAEKLRDYMHEFERAER